MAQATNTQLGEIQLAGDLAGNGGSQVGTNPQLKTIPGLTAGSYIIPRITVDQKGRITAIANGTADILAMLPNATADRPGIVSLGDNIYASGGDQPAFWQVLFGGTLSAGTATGLSNQACAMYGFDLQADNGIVQNISIAGSTAQTVSTLIGALNAKMSGAVAGLIGGNIIITSTTSGNQSSIKLTNIHLFACMTGFVNVGAETKGLGPCQIYVKRGSVIDYGVVKVGNGIDVNDGTISVDMSTLPVATAATLGGVIVPTAGNLTVAVDGSIAVPSATASTLGVVKVGAGLVAPSGVLAVSMPDATTSAKGIVQVGSNISVAAGVISVPVATSSDLGVAKIGAGLSVTSGVVSLAIASASSLGAVKGGGAGISIAGDGTISAIDVVIPDATTSVKGIVQVGSGLTIASGVLSVADATSSVKGVVQVGAGLSVTAGTVSAVLANGSTPGIVASASSARISIVNGVIDIAAGAMLSTTTANTFTKSQATAIYDLGVLANALPDFSQSNVFKWAPNSTTPGITAPYNMIAGGTYNIIITTIANTSILTLPSNFKFPNGSRPYPSSAGTDLLSCLYDGTNFLCTYVRGVV